MANRRRLLNGTEGDQASLKPYIAASIFLPFDGGQELVPGIRAIPAPGHTPGHTSYMVESNGQALLIWPCVDFFMMSQTMILPGRSQRKSLSRYFPSIDNRKG